MVPAGCPLTAAEFDVMRRISKGFTYKRVAVDRGVGLSTIRSQIHASLHKLDAFSSAQGIAVMLATGWLDPIQTAFEDTRAVTATQQLYLAAFLRWLRDPTDETIVERSFWLRAMYFEKRIVPPWEVLGVPRRPQRNAGANA